MSTENTGNEGGSGDQGSQEEDKGTQDAGNQGGEGNDDSGRAGSDEALKADLAKERKARQAAEKVAKANQARLDQLEEANKTENEKAIDKARKDGETEATAKANLKIAKMAIRAAAMSKFADPSDAVGEIDASKFEVDDDGDVDEKAINAELDQLLKRKPHWAKVEKKSSGSVDQGARGSGVQTTDMNQILRAGLTSGSGS